MQARDRLVAEEMHRCIAMRFFGRCEDCRTSPSSARPQSALLPWVWNRRRWWDMHMLAQEGRRRAVERPAHGDGTLDPVLHGNDRAQMCWPVSKHGSYPVYASRQ